MAGIKEKIHDTFVRIHPRNLTLSNLKRLWKTRKGKWIVLAILAKVVVTWGSVAIGIYLSVGPASNPNGNQMNHLSNEKSPYLLQHQNNPVWWWPWGDEAFKVARSENKPIFLSVGYSTCHWCHVMEHESFEDPQVADLLNREFVSIKVDREERPDVDAIYMAMVQSLTGHGGWPMSVWLTPEGKPFFGGTYFPKPQFMGMLNKIAQTWKDKRELIEADATKITEMLREAESKLVETGEGTLGDTELANFRKQMGARFDSNRGGFGHAPKFPQTMSLMALMRVTRRSGNTDGDVWVRKTLDEMARGGMYDHLGGGFHRYSTDDAWLVPHFEKMLYDNALLALTYLEAYQKYGDEEYARVVRETLDYVLRDMTDEKGGFFSAEDADSLIPEKGEKEEGYFYTFDWEEITNRLDEKQLHLLKEVYGVSKVGHYEGRNILHLQSGKDRSIRSREQHLEEALGVLLALRDQRPRPHLDDKILVSWNGLMIAALARASRVLGKTEYLLAAQRAADFIWSEMRVNEKLKRRWREGEAKFAAYADDYAALIFGQIELLQADGDEKWYERSLILQDQQNEFFWDEKNQGYFRDDGSDSKLIVRMKDDYDGVEPSVNSLSSYNLLRLGSLSGRREYTERAKQVFSLFRNRIEVYPSGLAMMLIALDYDLDRAKEIALVGEEEAERIVEVRNYLNRQFLPNVLSVYGKSGLNQKIKILEGKTVNHSSGTIYVCERGICQLPTDDITKVKAEVETMRWEK